MTKIAIIGAGISGLLTALEIQSLGAQITIYDKDGFPGRGASYAAAGMVNPSGEVTDLPLQLINAANAGVKFWSEFCKKNNISINAKGSIFIANKSEIGDFKNYIDALKNSNLAYEILDDEALLSLNFGLKFNKGIYFPNDITINSRAILKKIVMLLKEKGAQFIKSNVNPEYLKKDYEWVIDARGWTDCSEGLIAIKGETISIVSNKPIVQMPIRFQYNDVIVYIVPNKNNIFTIGASSRLEINPNPKLSRLDGIEFLIKAANYFSPKTMKMHIKEIKCGIRPAYPDFRPRIKYDGNIVSINGLYRHGFLLTPVMAKIIAKQIINKENDEFSELFYGRQNFNSYQTINDS